MEIIVTSDNQNPANFVSNFADSINVNDGYEIVVKSIFSPPHSLFELLKFFYTSHDRCALPQISSLQQL